MYPGGGNGRENKGSVTWMAEMCCDGSQKECLTVLIKRQGPADEDDGSDLSQSVLCGYNKIPGSR